MPTKFDDSQFANLPRHDNGDLAINIADVVVQLTAEQVDKLSADDWTRYHDICNELSIHASA